MSRAPLSQPRRTGRFLSVVVPVLAAPLLASCDPAAGVGVNLDQYDPIPPLEELDFEAIRPDQVWPYWELRLSQGFAEAADSVVGSGGTLRRNELPPEALKSLEDLRFTPGFAGCGFSVGRQYEKRRAASQALTADLAACSKYVVAVDESDEVVTFATRDALRTFLGRVESLEKAVLLLDAHGFSWDGDADGIRPLDSGWEAVVKELVKTCAPIQTDRVLITVSGGAELRIHRREVWSQHGGCY